MRKFLLLLAIEIVLGILLWRCAVSAQARTPERPAQLTPIAWQRQLIDARGFAGQSSDLVLDQNGHPHIIFWRSEGTSSILYYARWDGVTWIKERVDNRFRVGNEVSIAIDDQQRPHVVYQDSINQDLYYAFREASGWQRSRLLDQGVVGRFNNVALTNTGLAISYLDETQGALKVIFGTAGTFNFGAPQFVAQTTTLDQHGLAVNSLGRPGITYHDSSSGDLMLATRNINGTWSIETVADFADVGRTSSLIYDSSDIPHVTGSVLYQGRYFLNYYAKNGASWVEESVAADVNLNLGRFHEMTLDQSDRPVVAYINQTQNQLMLARRESPHTWQIETVDTLDISRVGGIGVDAANQPIMSGYQRSFGDLIVFSGGNDWQTRIVYDNNAQPNYRPSLALNGHSPAVAFHTEATQPDSAQLVTWDGYSWADDVVAPDADAAVTTPVVFAADGQPRIAYYRTSTRQVMYATLVNNVWQAVPVATLPVGTTMGPDLVLMLAGQQEDPTLAFSIYDGTAVIKVMRGIDGVWREGTLPVPGQSAPLTPLSADYHVGGAVGVAYFNPVNNTINEARFDGQWQESIVANGVQATAISTTVARHRRSNGTPFNSPTITYYDANTGQIIYARLADVSTWIPRVVATPSSQVNSLATVFIGNSTVRPRIAVVTVDNTVRLFGADSRDFFWSEETVVAAGAAVRSHVNLAMGDRERLTYLENGVVMHAFRTATTRAPVVPGEDSNGMVGLLKSQCMCLLSAEYCGRLLWDPRPDARSGLQAAAITAPFNEDGADMAALTKIFEATPEGQAFLDTYITHDLELTFILASDPSLTWDAFRTLENLMPGLSAFTKGQGSLVVIDQALMDQALDIWQRVEAEASPGLAAVINQYLTDTNNLQLYVGMTFDEWAATLGVNPPAVQKTFLPVVLR